MSRKAFYYSEAPYVHVLQGMYKALSCPEALVRLTGLPQTGKSALCEKLMLYMQHKGFRVVYFRHAIESPDMLRTMLARELELPHSTNFARMLEGISLSAAGSDVGKPLVLLFDDAHLLSDTTLLEIFQLMQIQSGAERKLNIVLCGEPVLMQKLARREELKSLRMHISHNFELYPMTKTEIHGFVLACMKKAGIPELQLEPAALAYAWKSTNGLPGETHALCSAMVTARRGSATIAPMGKAELMSLVQDMQASNSGVLPPGTPLRESNQWTVLGPIAAVVVIASIAMLYQQLQGTSEMDPEAPGLSIPIPVDEPVQDSPFVEVTDLGAFDAEVAVTVPIVAVVPVPATPVAAAVLEEHPFSDSDLVLVTAAERGVADAEIVVPVFEEITVIEELDVLDREPVVTPVVVAPTTEVLPEETVPSPVVEVAALTEVPTTPAAITPAITSVITSATVPETPGSEVASAAPVATPAVNDELPSSSAAAESAESVVDAAERDVSSWVAAWQAQNLEAYFASYHPNFEPRYHASVQRWQQDRSRVISNARSIQLTLTEFEIVAATPERIEVQFWLDYNSPSYADSTQKKLVLAKTDERWLILEEINLQVRS